MFVLVLSGLYWTTRSDTFVSFSVPLYNFCLFSILLVSFNLSYFAFFSELFHFKIKQIIIYFNRERRDAKNGNKPK
jgi:hypothetical protein